MKAALCEFHSLLPKQNWAVKAAVFQFDLLFPKKTLKQ